VNEEAVPVPGHKHEHVPIEKCKVWDWLKKFDLCYINTFPGKTHAKAPHVVCTTRNVCVPIGCAVDESDGAFQLRLNRSQH
jgi:hypothetical protein